MGLRVIAGIHKGLLFVPKYSYYSEGMAVDLPASRSIGSLSVDAVDDPTEKHIKYVIGSLTVDGGKILFLYPHGMTAWAAVLAMLDGLGGLSE